MKNNNTTMTIITINYIKWEIHYIKYTTMFYNYPYIFNIKIPESSEKINAYNFFSAFNIN